MCIRDSYGTATETKCSLSVGDQEVILSNDQLRAAGLKNWPDTVLGVWRDGDTYHFIGASPQDNGNLQYSALTNGTLDNPIADSTELTIPIRGVKDTFGYIGGGPVYRDPQSGTLILFYDTEKYRPDGSGVHNTTGMAKSTDNGKTWTDLGAVSYTHLRAHETVLDLVCRLLPDKKNTHPHLLIALFTPQ